MSAGQGRAEAPVVLVVAFPNSIHTARWLHMVRGHGLRFVLLPSIKLALCDELKTVRLVRTRADLDALSDQDVAVFDLDTVEPARIEALDLYLGYQPWLASFLSDGDSLSRPAHVMEAITRLRPAIVHSMETQFSGYLCMAVKRFLGPCMPPWFLTSWGSDLYLYRKMEEHLPRLSELALSVDAYLGDCERDAGIFRDLGFRGLNFPPMPASGGASFADLPAIGALPPPSQRREIMVKGYHGWSGRVMHILNAIHLIAPSLRNFSIHLTHTSFEVVDYARTIAEWDDLEIVCDPHFSTHGDVMARLARSRMMVGVGLSDGTPTTLLEAMSVGAFPIQGTTSAADEWITDGRSGFVVSPHDVGALAGAIQRAATDDSLVDGCVAVNRRSVEARWDAGRNALQAIGYYRALLSQSASRG